MIVIGDTCTILFCARSNLLKYLFDKYEKIYIPKFVETELSNATGNDKLTLIGFKFTVKDVDENLIQGLDKGESDAIQLYKNIGADMLITDDTKAINFCKSNSINVKKFASIFDMFLQESNDYGEIVRTAYMNRNILPKDFWLHMSKSSYDKFVEVIKETYG